MVMRKAFGGILAGAILVTSAKYGYDKIFAAPTRHGVTLLDYSSTTSANKPFSVKINSLKSLHVLGWLNANEVLTATKKDDFKNPDSIQEVDYLSTYNTETGKTKEFKDTNVSSFINISPDKKYALYEEPKSIPKVSGEEWQKDLDSGKIYNYSVKLINLQTGEVKSLSTKYKNKETNYSWVDNDKLLMFYPNENDSWVIQNLAGKEIKSGKYKEPANDYHSWNVFNLNTTAKDNNLKGAFTIQQFDPSIAGVTTKSTYFAIDSNTGAQKQLYRSNGFSTYTVQNNVLLAGDDTDKQDQTKLLWFDQAGNKKGETTVDGLVFVDRTAISKDGTKAAFLMNKVNSKDFSINVLDFNTGKVNKVYEGNSIFVGNGVDNLSWNADGTKLSFSCVTDSGDHSSKAKVDIEKIKNGTAVLTPLTQTYDSYVIEIQ